jgi:hypothetical protein
MAPVRLFVVTGPPRALVARLVCHCSFASSMVQAVMRMRAFARGERRVGRAVGIQLERMDFTSSVPHPIRRTEYPFRFTVCTLVTRREQYQRMLDTFLKAGFSEDRCEYLYVDNTLANEYDAYEAFNLFLQKARGRYVIVCHQDVELLYDDIADLEQRIEEMDKLDPRWALLGNSGGINLEHRATWITDGDEARFYSSGRRFPQRVKTLDENFILVKNEANLAVSADLGGFHFYGTDICLIAGILGFNAYVIAFNVYHRSAGKIDDDFRQCKRRLQKKYQRALKPRYLQTTMTRLYLSGSELGCALLSTSLVQRMVRLYHRVKLFFSGQY